MPGNNEELAAALRGVLGGEVQLELLQQASVLARREHVRDRADRRGIPRDGDEVAAVVSTAAEFGVPVLPRGAGATREEEHSTRGRANALLYALSTPDPHATLSSWNRLHGILDLCLECKACKSECPLGVDMAALKTEALAAYHDQHSDPERSRMFGSIRTLNRLGSAAFPLSNLAAGWRPGRLLAERWLGVSAARPLPRFQRQDLRGWFRRRRAPARPAHPRRADLPGRLVHHLHRTRCRTFGHRTAGTGRLAGPVRKCGLLRPDQPVQGAGGPGPADGGGPGRPPRRGGCPRRADRRGGALVPADPAR